MMDSGLRHLINAHPLWRTAILDFLTRQTIYPYTFHEDDTFFLLRWRESEHLVDEYHQRAATLCRYGIVMEYYGLSYKDLMELDFVEFEKIENEVKKIAEERAKLSKAKEPEMQALMKQPSV